MTKQKCIQAQWELLNGSLESLGAKLTTNVGKQLLKRNIRGALTNYGLDISENFLEEAIVEPISELVAQTAGGKDKANWENMEQRFFKSGIDGAVTSMITGGISGVIGGVASKRQNNQYIDINRNTRLDKNTQNILKQAENIVRETNKLNVKPINPPIQNKNILQSTQPQNKDIGQRLNKLRNIDTSNMGLLEKSKIKTEIRALESGYSSIEEYRNSEEQKKQKALEEYKQKEEYKRLKTKQEELAKKTQIQEQLTNTTPLKRRQYQIIQNTNPMNDDVHVGIRTPTDIKTFNEVINDEESFVWGDYSKEDAKNDLKKGTVTLYSSYPIKNGTFVSTSKQQAIEYAGGNANKVYSKTVPLNEVAWINGDEGQYAKVVANNGKTLYNNNESESGINGEVQREGMDGISGQYDTRVQQESKSKQNYTKTGYEQWEKSIKPSNYITNEQKQIKDNIKNKYGKDIVFFYESNGDYNAGSSLKDKNTIYINPLECKEFGIQKTALHEVIESNIAYYREISDDIIQPTIQQIIQDSNFEKQKKEFWQDQLGEMPSDYAIAKDILCDRFAEMETGEKSDYSNVLSKPTNMTIDYSIKNFNQELDKSSSYILPKNKIIQETELPYREEVNINKPKKSSFYNNAMSSNALTKEAKGR